MEFDQGQYCVSIRPPMFGSSTILPNYFHLPCFAKLANLTYLPHLHRLWPLNRFTWHRADIAIASPGDSWNKTTDRFLDVGAEHLLQELKWRYYSRCQIKSKMEINSVHVKRYQAGLMHGTDTEVPAVTDEEQRLLSAPIKATTKRNLFDVFLLNTTFADTITRINLDLANLLWRWETLSRHDFVDPEETDDVRATLEELGNQPNSSNYYDKYADWTAVNKLCDPEKPLPPAMVGWSINFHKQVHEPVELALSSAAPSPAGDGNNENNEDSADEEVNQDSEDIMSNEVNQDSEDTMDTEYDDSRDSEDMDNENSDDID
ncbi:hypothetical protein FPOA_02189 [Fusarium poae]|uniref:Uncharacterized protein n=1 Tax=Fusarium poae TaxID=36050 RepID=A0A1B8B690_FUSPO|nr:hypothetical protein FPOA_02189 [Fusarium poae]